MTTEFEGIGQTPSVGEMQDMLTQKATELFMLCDKEEKGFITKRDMQRLCGELPLSPDQLEAVFDSLDDDGNGYLTLEEFTEGFGGFLGFGAEEATETDGDKDVYEAAQNYDTTQEDDIAFKQAMDSLGAQELFDDSGRGKQGRLQHYDQQHIKDLWKKLKKDEPELLGDFEDFVQKVSSDIRKARVDSDELESALRNKAYTHDEEVRKLYEEMENQIKAEKERILNEEKEKERKIRTEMSQEIYQKDEQLQELLKKQSDLERKIEELNVTQDEISAENETLAKYNDDLQCRLEDTSLTLNESKQYLKELQDKSMREKRERAQAALRVTEGIAQERESLVKQLDLLRDMNKKLRDEKDMHDAARQATKGESKSSPKKGTLTKQGSIMSNYFSPTPPKRKAKSREVQPQTAGEEEVDGEMEMDGELGDEEEEELDGVVLEDDIEVDDDDYYIQKMKENGDMVNGIMESEISASRIDELQLGQSVGNYDSSSNQVDRLGQTDELKRKQILKNGTATILSGDSEDSLMSTTSSITSPTSPRGEPVGCHATTDSSVTSHEILEPLPKHPERVYKVVFVGDSGVGKSSFIHRFCNDSFKSNFSATIGVDFQVKNVIVDRKMVALQLWDTAGQERFRSITKQYFRKADGVLILYDVTSESSFTSVRNWMASVQEGVEEGTVTLILGNKLDIEEQRQVKQKEGHRLAEDFESLFFEGSAKSGYNVDECIQAMARKLLEREDQEMEKALTLGNEIQKKKGCCD